MAAYLEEAVFSVINQSFNNWECIIVNDGSTDNTEEIANGIIRISRGGTIRLVNKNNGGTADARNAGIGVSTGEWILPLDADDSLHRDFISKCMSVIEKDPKANLVYTDATIFGCGHGTASLDGYSEEGILSSNRLPYASLYRRILWEKTGGYNPSIPWGVEDWNFWIDCSRIGLRVHRINEPLLNYRVHENGSRNAKAMCHWNVVSAAMQTLHPDRYPRQQLLNAHGRLATMNKDTNEEVKRVTVSFPKLPMPYFWLGLAAENDGRYIEAMKLYESSVSRVADVDWQARLYLYRLLRLSGGKDLEKSRVSLTDSLDSEFVQLFCRQVPP